MIWERSHRNLVAVIQSVGKKENLKKEIFDSISTLLLIYTLTLFKGRLEGTTSPFLQADVAL